MTPLKTVRKSIRMTERDYEFVESLPGADFSDKLCTLIRMMREQKKEEDLSSNQIMSRLNDIEALVRAMASGQNIEM